MCQPHVYRNVTPKLKHLQSLDKDLAGTILGDIEDLQWSALNQRVFLHVYDLLEQKYLSNEDYDDRKVAALAEFFAYLRKVWIESEENNWFEGANAFDSSNNQSLDGKNKEFKASHTFRKRMPLGSFIDCMLRMVHEWSLEDATLLTTHRSNILFTKPNGLKLRTDGFTWYKEHENNSNFVKIHVSGRKTVSEDLKIGKVDAIWLSPAALATTTLH